MGFMKPKQPAPYVPPAPLEQPVIQAPTLKDVLTNPKDEQVDLRPRGRQSTIIKENSGDDFSGAAEGAVYKKKMLGG